jgi:hypothetical protein
MLNHDFYCDAITSRVLVIALSTPDEMHYVGVDLSRRIIACVLFIRMILTLSIPSPAPRSVCEVSFLTVVIPMCTCDSTEQVIHREAATYALSLSILVQCRAGSHMVGP